LIWINLEEEWKRIMQSPFLNRGNTDVTDFWPAYCDNNAIIANLFTYTKLLPFYSTYIYAIVQLVSSVAGCKFIFVFLGTLVVVDIQSRSTSLE
jgi:hypothetical protein